jgi:uncharacterized membrane protein YfcA
MVIGFALLLIGFLSGAYGIIVGAGGGFVFVPALLILLQLSPEVAAGTGLVVVFINSVSGVFGYVRQKRIDYKLGIVLAIGATPGTFLGVWLTQISSSQAFYWIFASVLITLGIFLIVKKTPGEKRREKLESAQNETAATFDEEVAPVMEIDNKTLVYLLMVGIVLGVASSFFGIGGGWLLVPILIYLFRVLPHFATATSIFSLCLYSAVGVMIHIFQGNIDWTATIWGGIGVLMGAQLGVYLSNKFSGKRIIQMLAIILIGVGIKLFFN